MALYILSFDIARASHVSVCDQFAASGRCVVCHPEGTIKLYDKLTDFTDILKHLKIFT